MVQAALALTRENAVKIVCIGGGPAGLYFALLMKKANPDHDITVIERNAPYQTFGWGVVFSDETLSNLLETDDETHREIEKTFAHWDSIDVYFKGKTLRSTGHGFSGIARKKLLNILQRRCESLGVKLVFNTEVEDLAKFRDADLIVAADGVNSKIRASLASVFTPSLDVRKCRYIWLGTKKLFDAFTFLFEKNEHGIFAIHAYRFDDESSTFIAECREETWKAAGLDKATTEESVHYLESLFSKHLDGNKLLENRSSWINFTTVRNQTWRHDNVVLLGDAAHTAHFSIGSGTKLAIEDAIALFRAFQKNVSVKDALEAYEDERRPVVLRTQKAAEDSLVWFENVQRYWEQDDLSFAIGLLTRSKRVTWENLRLRDPALVQMANERFTEDAFAAASRTPPIGALPPPMFTPFRLRDMVLENRVVVSPMCMYSAENGTPNDFHLVHLGARAMGGAGLLITEMTNISADARITPGCTGIYDETHVAAWKRIVDFVHERSAAKLCLQLGHAGRKGSTKVLWEGFDVPLDQGNWPLISASAIPYKQGSQTPRAMTEDDMTRVTNDYVRAVERAERAGFDMLELHMAHGYLLGCFVSPLTNVREDEYGGSLQNRMRYPLSVLDAVRNAWPSHKPMSVRISATDWVPGGFEGEDAVVLSRELKSHGVDIVNVSTGQTSPDEKPIYGRMFQSGYSDQVRNEADIPTMNAGNVTNADQVNSMLTARRADLVLLARAHLNDPNWTLHAADQQGYHLARWPLPYSALERSRGRL